jgi:hypothetical protein
MSQSNKPEQTPDAAKYQDSNKTRGEPAKHTETTAPQAPYQSMGKWRRPGEYRVVFQPGFSLAEHFAFLGFDFDPMCKYFDGYAAVLDEQMFQRYPV